MIFRASNTNDESLTLVEVKCVAAGMKSNSKKPMVLALFAVLGLMVGRRILSVSDYVVSDALFFVGMVVLLLGVLAVVRNSRFFDVVGHNFARFVEVVLNRPRDRGTQADDYSAYCSQPRPRQEPRAFLGLGSICLLLSLCSALMHR